MKPKQRARTLLERAVRSMSCYELSSLMSHANDSESMLFETCQMLLLKEKIGTQIVVLASQSFESIRGLTREAMLKWIERSGGVVGTMTDTHHEQVWGMLVSWKNIVLYISFRGNSRNLRSLRGNRTIMKVLCQPAYKVSLSGLGLLGDLNSIMHKCREFISRYKVKRPVAKTIRRGVHLLSMTKHGPQMRMIASVEDVLESGNYTTAIIDDFTHVVRDLSNPDPCGRLVLIHGPPGTGKTFFVRGLIEAAEGVRFVLIPSQIITQLTVPGLADMLMRQRTPTCLVIEDADMLLVERMSDNMASVGALLNLADGIFGVLADVRIVATTNAGKLDIDPALIRNGRLCRHIEIPHLGSERAREIYQRLTGKAEAPAFARDAVLADVYQAARPDIQKKPEPAEKPGLGFRRA